MRGIWEDGGIVIAHDNHVVLSLEQRLCGKEYNRVFQQLISVDVGRMKDREGRVRTGASPKIPTFDLNVYL